MIVTNREARQWDKVHHQAAMRQIAKQRQALVAPFLRGQKVHAPKTKPGAQQGKTA